MADSDDDFNFDIPDTASFISGFDAWKAPVHHSHVTDDDVDDEPHNSVLDDSTPPKNRLPSSMADTGSVPQGPVSLNIAEIIQMMSFDPSARSDTSMELPLLVIDWSKISGGRYFFLSGLSISI